MFYVDKSFMRILVVDDELDLRESFVDFIRLETDSTVDQCGNGEEAMSYCSHTQYDLIILDYRMPKMTGLQLIDELRRTKNSNMLSSAIVLLSGFVEEIKIDIAPEENILLRSKPIRPDEFLDLILFVSQAKSSAS